MPRRRQRDTGTSPTPSLRAGELTPLAVAALATTLVMLSPAKREGA